MKDNDILLVVYDGIQQLMQISNQDKKDQVRILLKDQKNINEGNWMFFVRTTKLNDGW